MLRKVMKVGTDVLAYHIVCSKCNVYVGSYSSVKFNIQCKCGSTIMPSSVGSFFIEVDVKDQLKKLFSNPEVIRSIEDRSTREKKNCDNLKDIYDGTVL